MPAAVLCVGSAAAASRDGEHEVPGLSAKLFALTLDTALPHVQKMVMLALANQANDYGEDCFPSFELIQRHSSLSRRTVFQALAALEEGGYRGVLVWDERPNVEVAELFSVAPPDPA